MALLEVKDLNVSYGAIRALHGVSFHVEEGEVVTLIGANGAGKSTTLRTISGLLPVTSGEVWYNGENITGADADRIVSKGVIQVPEGRRIFAPLTVRENLEMGAYSRKDKDEIAASMEHVFHLFPRMKERLEQAGVLIVVAGMEGALASVVGGLVHQPVIAVPTSIGYGASFGGMAALLSMLNSCATGVTVVNIDNGFGAAAAATRINRIRHDGER